VSKILVKQLLTSSNYWSLNKTVVKLFGIKTAFLLTNLAEAESMMSDDDGWFYQTSEKLEEISTLSRYKQDKSIDELIDAGILEKDVRGIPAKRYFRLDYKALANKIVNNSQTSVKKDNKLDSEKLTTNKELNKENKNKETTNKNGVNVHAFYQDNFGTEPPTIAQDLEYWVEDLSKELVILAMQKALENEKTYSYAKGIMRNWANKNITTIEQVEQHEKKFNRNNKNSNENNIDDWFEELNEE